jgi:UDP-N-acetylglucosamine--N-acetylmuramyl-(pentapeptide) pyrophosphoryl-undecaprenol N-acetylglucosamine transferase
VREAFFHVPPAAHGGRLHLLVFGGSQGARAINRAAVAAAVLWQRQGRAVSVLHQTGTADYNEVQNGYAAAGIPVQEGVPSNLLPGEEEKSAPLEVRVAPFLDDMPGAMAWADLVVCRSGASTLAELAAAGRASILVPFPGAADHHQWKNADAYRRAGAAWLLEQKDLTGEALAAAVTQLTAAPEAMLRMEAAVRDFAHPGAAAWIAGLMEQTASPRKSRKRN